MTSQRAQAQRNWKSRSTYRAHTRYDIKYDLFGRSTFLGHGNDVIDTVNYHGKEQNYRPQSRITTLPGAGPGLFLHYEDYQKNGLLKKVNDLVYGPGNPLRNAAQFAYDGLGRLTAVTNSEMNGSYEHSDKLGNLTRKDGTALRYQDASRPHRITRATGGLAPYGNIAYDGNGNQSAWGDRTYAYTGDDRLREVSGAGYAVRFHYDGSGARIAKSDLTAGVTWYIGDLMEVSPAYVTKYYFAGGRRIASQRYWRPPYFLAAARPWVQVASAVLAGGVPAVVVTVHEGGKWILGFVALGGIAILWIPGRRKAVVGIRLRRGPVLGVILAFTLASLPVPVVVRPAQAGGGGPADDTIGIRHYHYDHLGSVQLMTTANGGVYRQVRYNAYGMVRGTWGAAGQTASGCSVTGYCIGYTGYDQEPKSQILYARARFYDPGLGIFLTHDPARQFANPYTYVGWNPINATDPSGMWVDFAIAIGAAVVSALAASGIAVAIDAYVRTGDALGATKAGLVSHGMNGLAPGTSYGMQLIAPDTFGKPDPGNYAIGLIPVVGSAYGSAQSFRAGNYASGVVGAAATVYAAYGAYQTIKSMYQQYFGAGAGQGGIGGGTQFATDGSSLSDASNDIRIRWPEVVVTAAREQGLQRPWFDPVDLVAGLFAGVVIGAVGIAASGVRTVAGDLVSVGARQSIHLTERMAERGITERMVGKALEKGTRYWDPKNKTANYVLEGGFASGQDLLVGQNPVTGNVTTAIRGWSLVRPRMVPWPE